MTKLGLNLRRIRKSNGPSLSMAGQEALLQEQSLRTLRIAALLSQVTTKRRYGLKSKLSELPDT